MKAAGSNVRSRLSVRLLPLVQQQLSATDSGLWKPCLMSMPAAGGEAHLCPVPVAAAE